MIKKAILLVCVPVLVLGLAAVADWHPEDGHKMHHAQLPDETGWAVNATQPLILADDFRCMETGWIKDIHFWGAWRHGDVGQVQTFWLSLHSDIPADQNPDGYSKPGETLREWEISDWTAVPIDPPTMEGWYDPATNDTFPEDHYAYFQYNVFLPEADWFPQDSGTIYWLNISAIVQDPVNTQWGWKSTQDHWNDDAVWAEWGDLSWVEMYEPEEPVDTLINDFNIFIDPAGNFQGGSGGGAHPPGWVLYPDDWWTIWYYDHPLDTTRFKEVLLEYEIYIMDPGQPSFVEIAINWSNEEWPDDLVLLRSPSTGPTRSGRMKPHRLIPLRTSSSSELLSTPARLLRECIRSHLKSSNTIRSGCQSMFAGTISRFRWGTSPMVTVWTLATSTSRLIWTTSHKACRTST
jgi:hypothetical protein